jgi:hypothetical protein
MSSSRPTIIRPAPRRWGWWIFIDEWVSAPYPHQQHDRTLIEEGLAWLDAESTRRFATEFAAAKPADQAALCDDICDPPRRRNPSPRRQPSSLVFAI